MAKILDRTTTNRVFLIYGNLGDMFLAEDLIPCRFEYYLMKYLKSLGFEHVVFFSPNDKGRFTLDDESAAFTERKKRISSGMKVKQEGESGHKLRMGKRKKRKAEDAQGELLEKETGGRTDSAMGSLEKENPEKEDSWKEHQETEGTVSDLKYKFSNINIADFQEMAQSYLSGRNGKTAVVFTNIQTFLNPPPPPKYHSMLSKEWVSYTNNPDAGACIFLAPNACVSGINRILSACGMPEISNYFFEGGEQIRYDRTICVGEPEKDEIRNLLEYMRIVGYQYKRRSFRLFFERRDLETIVDCIYRCSRNRDLQPKERDLTQLSGIYDYLSDYVYQKCRGNLRAKGIKMSVSLARQLFQNTGSDSEVSALEKLHVKGWEPVYERLKNIVEITEKNRKKENKQIGQDVEIVLATEKEEEKTQGFWEQEAPICVSRRLDADFGENVEEEEGKYTGHVPSFILKGHPGVGKTEIAKMIASVLYEAGILRTDHCLIRDKKMLVSNVVGGTEVMMRELLMDAQEGVLFIDEAYELFTGDENSNDFGKHVLDALLPVVDPGNPSHRICVILAGYPEEMDKMMAGSNSGLLSRFSEENNILIPDATPELMYEKFLEFIEERGFSIPEEDGKPAFSMEVFFENMYKRRNRRTFGNFRDVKKIAESACGNASLRSQTQIRKEDFGIWQKFFESTGPRTADAALAQLDEYVGMEKVKEKLQEVRANEEKREEEKARNIPNIGKPKHYIFVGNPGVGKTTVGTIMGQLFHLLGILGAEETRVVDASELLGDHATNPTAHVRKVLQEVIDNNQFLFIDEGYQILDNVHKNEIVSAMLNPLSEKGEEFRMAISLYPDRVEDFMETNPGVDRRFEIIRFEDYGPSQLMEIFDRNCKRLRLGITEEAKERVSLILKQKYNTRDEKFGNAAVAIDLLTAMDANRYRRMKQEAQETDEIYTLTLKDIPEKELKDVESMVHPKTTQEIQKEIDSMIGMQGLREIMKQKADDIAYIRKAGKKEDIYHLEPGHYFFIGAPGTGKTTSARMFAEYLYSIGVIKSNKFTPYSSKDLVSGYVGQSDKLAAQMLERGRNGVIFIDEAHELAVSYGDNHTSYEQQVLSQLIQYMEDEEFKKTTCIILAGYDGQIQKLFDRRYGGDPGLLSRGKKVFFPNYNAQESYQIFEKFCVKNGVSIGDGVKEKYLEVFEGLVKCPEYANGRSVRTIFRETASRMKARVVHTDDTQNLDTITQADLLGAEEAKSVLGL